MPSPFPGMDPYLESQPFWADFHTGMIMAMKGALQKRVPQRYSVWTDVHVWIHEPAAATRLRPIKPDASIVTDDRDFASRRPTTGESLPILTSPATTLLPARRKSGHRFLKIKETRMDRVVTVVELLSPANKKRGEDRDDYLSKRNLYFAEGINLVELDLLRGGTRMPLGRPTPPEAPYYGVVCRGIEYPKMAIWPIALRDPLPEIPIPLNPEDDLIMLPLQQCFENAYEAGPYDRAIDYSKAPKPPLTAADVNWARKRVASASMADPRAL